MDPITLGLIAVGVGGAIKVAGDLFDNTASKEADLMRQQAALKTSALEETMRRREGEQTQVLSSTKARMAATGFATDSASFTNYLAGMSAEFQKQNTFAEKSGLASIDLMKQSADIMDDPMKKYLGAAADAVGTAGRIFGMFKPSPDSGGGAGIGVI